MLDNQLTYLLEEGASRRAFLRNTGVGTAGLAAAVAGGALSSPAQARRQAPGVLTDADIFNFALNFEYLGAEYYLAALGASGLPASLTTGTGTKGNPSGGVVLPPTTKVPFENRAIFYFAEQLAVDEYAHVTVIREVLGNNAIAEPNIDLAGSWTTFAVAAGLIGPGQTFDPFASEVNFLLGAYVLEDVCVTALCGAASLISNKTNLAYAASILGVEAYQIGMIRQRLSAIGAGIATDAISQLRSKLANQALPVGTDDFGTDANGNAFNFTNTDVNAQAFRRTFTQVLAIAYGTTTGPSGPAVGGGFFPDGVNGQIKSTPS